MDSELSKVQVSKDDGIVETPTHENQRETTSTILKYLGWNVLGFVCFSACVSYAITRLEMRQRNLPRDLAQELKSMSVVGKALMGPTVGRGRGRAPFSQVVTEHFDHLASPAGRQPWILSQGWVDAEKSREPRAAEKDVGEVPPSAALRDQHNQQEQKLKNIVQQNQRQFEQRKQMDNKLYKLRKEQNQQQQSPKK